MVTAATMIGGAAHASSLWDLLILTILTNVVYFLTHLFAEAMTAHQHDAPASSLRHHAWESWPMVTAGFTPMIVTALGALAGLPLTDAVWLGLGWVGLGLGLFTWMELRHKGVPLHRRIGILLVAISIAGLLVGAKLALH